MAAVTVERRGALALVRVDNPPVNALSTAVRQGLLEAVRAVAEDAAIRGAVLVCRGRTFMAGADVREFGQATPPPDLPTVVAAIEDGPKPWLAAIHGTALGGGLEVALGCRYRVAVPGAKLGLPEVKLGIIPGAGGTQRLPRLVGMAAALDLVAGGRQASAAEALGLGLVDAVVEGELEAAAIGFLEARPEAAPPRTRERPLPAFDGPALEAKADAIRAKARGLMAPGKAAEAVLNAGRLPFAEALAAERAIFLELRGSAQAAALRHLFLAERAAGKVPGLEGVEPRPIERVGLVGGGTMGSGIAVACLEAGLPVVLVETDREAAARARQRVATTLADLVERGRLTAEGREAHLHRLAVAADLAALRGVDLVIEAVVEHAGVKAALFEELGAILAPEALLATNTSYLDVAALARASGRPERVLGLHFFAPANVMRLLEVVRHEGQAPATLATGLAFGKRLGKLGIVAGNAEGFIGNALWAAYRRQLDYLLADGADPYAIDAAMTAYGFPMGPFAVFDLSGLDIAWAQRKRRAATRPAGERYVRIADALCERGRLGRKAGAGWYRYEGGKHLPDPEVLALVEAERAAMGVAPHAFTPEAIQARARAAFVNEAAKLLERGIALRPGDVDLVMVNGYGFPAWRGGPLHEADSLGLASLLPGLEAMARAGGAGSEPAPLLVELARTGRTFAAWAEGGS